MLLIDDASHFQTFAKVVARAIATYGHLPEEDLVEMQRKQVEGLAALEVKFRKALIKDPNGKEAYLNFVSFILDKEKNILAARPYFRERRSFFASDVSGAIRDRNVKALQKFHVNYHFVNLIKKTLKFGPKVQKLVKEIQESRQQLIVMNLP